jgi:hypothetical protein
MAIKGVGQFYGKKKKHIVTVQTEHKCVLDSCRTLEREHGFEITYLPVQQNGTCVLWVDRGNKCVCWLPCPGCPGDAWGGGGGCAAAASWGVIGRAWGVFASVRGACTCVSLCNVGYDWVTPSKCLCLHSRAPPCLSLPPVPLSSPGPLPRYFSMHLSLTSLPPLSHRTFPAAPTV